MRNTNGSSDNCRYLLGLMNPSESKRFKARRDEELEPIRAEADQVERVYSDQVQAEKELEEEGIFF